MARMTEVPSDLLALARVIPPVTLASMEPRELLLRLEYAAALIGLAELSDESEAKRLRRTAKRHLEALSLRELVDRDAALSEQISLAVRDGDERLEAFLRQERENLPCSNPQPPDSRLRDTELAALIGRARKYDEQATAKRRWFRKKDYAK